MMPKLQLDSKAKKFTTRYSVTIRQARDVLKLLIFGSVGTSRCARYTNHGAHEQAKCGCVVKTFILCENDVLLDDRQD